jgi:hypothetical protein
MKNRLNNQKSWLSRGKTTKNAVAFQQNKPNLKNMKICISSLETNKYEVLSACRNKNQTQSKPNSNPISKKPKMNINIYHIKEYNNETFFLVPKTKPNKAKVANNQSSLINNRFECKPN